MRLLLFVFVILSLLSCSGKGNSENYDEQEILNQFKRTLQDTTDEEVIFIRDTT